MKNATSSAKRNRFSEPDLLTLQPRSGYRHRPQVRGQVTFDLVRLIHIKGEVEDPCSRKKDLGAGNGNFYTRTGIGSVYAKEPNRLESHEREDESPGLRVEAREGVERSSILGDTSGDGIVEYLRERKYTIRFNRNKSGLYPPLDASRGALARWKNRSPSNQNKRVVDNHQTN